MKALILDNKVVDVVSTEFEVLQLTWVDCDDTVKSGYDYKDGKFTDPRLTDEQKLIVHYIRRVEQVKKDMAYMPVLVIN